MDEGNELRETSPAWRPAQAYTLSVICLIIGLAIGYFLRGSAAPSQTAAASPRGAGSAADTGSARRNGAATAATHAISR